MEPLLFVLLFLAVSPSSAIRKIGDKSQDVILTLVHSSQPDQIDPSRVAQLSRKPRVFIYKGFLSDEECLHLISLTHGKPEKSMVENKEKNTKTAIRTSSGTFLQLDQDKIVSKIEDKIAAWSLLPKENGEPLQILHYGVNEKYQPHLDYIKDEHSVSTTGQRVAAVLIFLSNVTRGGETIFPESEVKNPAVSKESMTPCGGNYYSVKPIKGDALLFFTLHPNMTADESSVHGSCPVLEGEKWSATKWIHTRPFRHNRSPYPQTSDDCTDEQENCPLWAARGECERNPVFMVGSPDYQGTCRKSCSVC